MPNLAKLCRTIPALACGNAQAATDRLIYGCRGRRGMGDPR